MIANRIKGWNKAMRFECWIIAAGPAVLAVASLTGCSPADAQAPQKVPAAVRVIPVTVAPLERRTVERTIDVVGTLRGWEQVTIGSKRTGRVSKVLHDMGDHVRPGEPLVQLDAVDAKLAYDQAQSRYLGELVKLGISEQQAQRFIEQYGISEELIRGKQAEAAIDRVPAVIQVLVSKDKALHNLNRQRTLSNKGASTVQELEDCENEYRSASAAYENARATARNVIASAVTNRVARNQAIQTLEDMTIRVPKPELIPPGSSQAEAVVYAVTKRSVSEGQIVKEGEAVCDLIIENPLRLWTSVPECYAERVRSGQPVRIAVASQPAITFQGKIVRINPSVDPVSRTFQVESQVPNDRPCCGPAALPRRRLSPTRRPMLLSPRSSRSYTSLESPSYSWSRTARPGRWAILLPALRAPGGSRSQAGTFPPRDWSSSPARLSLPTERRS